MNLQKLYTSTLTLQRNEYLKAANTTDTNIYFVESGSLRIFILDGSEEQVIRFGYPDNIIVALDSFFLEKPSEFYIQALKKTIVKVIPKSVFYEFVEQSEENKKVFIKMLEDLILQQMEREKDILTSSPKERYNRVLARSPRLFQEIPNKHIANYLRMSAETLSRLKKS
ncbi:CRP-like cAMP-binding protein [Flavobacterium arsenatis]|uniref:CRP-like cAMP-binding protein n=1 Tax=Flavobacterium arsenatis TaxID=1484332 RepID=A0ABU1TSJ6_9FLAO|nr:Crp/Fnr family transcriptional regulator [Flavobacterium arsenatis]MDR6968850.1 CRP-like cAMP-binding protein [Flavobacterium arsenatis]